MRNCNQLLPTRSFNPTRMIHQMAPWVPTFIQSTKNNPKPFLPFQLATVDVHTNKPRCRTLVFRDFLFMDKRSNVLTFHIDLRSNKVAESFSLDSPTPVEACFYFAETREQYRFSGHCFLITKRNHSEIPQDVTHRYGIISPSVCGHHKDELYKFATEDERQHSTDNSNRQERVLSQGDFKPPLEQEWGMELKRQWSRLSRSSKSQYRKPNPGTELTTQSSNLLDKINRGVDGSKEETGLENFAIACICVDEVDYLNLTSGSGDERVIFSRSVEGGTENWDEKHVCP
ncbi:hypothetical protein ZYGR_0A05230 [Zygosaccharomyces rouxii]|uniref:ZYRO0A11968p n=2 Tax=Zygosaccharomyces rouxii TaxID=4956 RepID=C5DNW1_ZYGRC|nr:uncharacterized protein ZYRO0A11968g [Zygosaccharomyces rouxii]KAH9198524.1 pyridoxamine 5'-phosphate oxidase-domain-containing protein [Zygosaccharomyces rouxii]GAV46925.1 hypothetical protein ZYGR_0A05230 [Zygosaccharomyces rouxii]CAR25952.1 ZYRO0A11968p [Zygosaccharomyces rouxii]